MGLRILRTLLIMYGLLYLSKQTHAQCAGGAAPQQITHSIGPIGVTGLIQNFNYPKFNPALGTLIGVDIDLNTSGYTMLQLINGDGFDNQFYFMKFVREEQLAIPGMGISIVNSVTKNFPDTILGASHNPTAAPPYSINGDGSNEWWGDALIPDNLNYSQAVSSSAFPNFTGTTGSASLMYIIQPQFSALGFGSHYTMNVVTMATNVTMSLTYTYCPQSILPAGEVEFKANKKSNNNVLLTWTKENEENNILYIPEVSLNGQDFKSIGNMQSQKPAQESTVVKYEYGYDVPVNTNGKLYFRLKQIDPTGEISYSSVRIINIDEDGKLPLTLFPNPADRQVEIRFETPQRQKLQADMISSVGQVVESRAINLNGAQLYTFPFSKKHPPGVYFMRVFNPATKEQQVVRLVIQ